MKGTVIIPTYCRPNDLNRCLRALTQQIMPPYEVIVVVRDEDAKTWAMLEQLKSLPLAIKPVTVRTPGMIAAMNAGISIASGDFIAFTDDDAAPYPDWLQRIEAHFLDNVCVGGVGGRDNIQSTEPWAVGAREVVGKLQWHGRVIGEHHRGVGSAREVDVLKGVNMSFRRSIFDGLQFDERLHGKGAQVHNELAFCLALKRQGWKIIYDPKILVNHYIAQRFDEDQRNAFNAVAWANKAHNETVGLLDHLPLIRKIIYLAWAFLVGTRDVLGFVQLCRFLPIEKDLAVRKWLASTQGRWQGIRTWMQPSSPNS